MKTRMIAFYLYFIACIVTMISIMAEWETMILISKPVIIPTIYFYYLTKTKSPNLLFSIIILLNFIGDSIVLLRLDNTLYLMIPYFFAYLLMLRFVIKDISGIKHNPTNVLLSVGVMALLAVIVWIVLDIQSEDGMSLLPPMIVYGIVLCALVTLAAYNYFADGSISSFYMLMACACAWGSDIFYVIYNLHFHIPVLNYINSSLQYITYFFLVKYMIARKRPISAKHSF